MSDEITGRDDYLITQALFIASAWLAEHGKESDAEDMEMLMRSPQYAVFVEVIARDFDPRPRR